MSEKHLEFQPVVLDGHQLVYSDADTFPSEFMGRIENVFKYYNQDYKLSSQGKILVPESLYKDMELMWNYTTKAQDQDWIRNRLK